MKSFFIKISGKFQNFTCIVRDLAEKCYERKFNPIINNNQGATASRNFYSFIVFFRYRAMQSSKRTQTHGTTADKCKLFLEKKVIEAEEEVRFKLFFPPLAIFLPTPKF